MTTAMIAPSEVNHCEIPLLVVVVVRHRASGVIKCALTLMPIWTIIASSEFELVLPVLEKCITRPYGSVYMLIGDAGHIELIQCCKSSS